MKIAVSGATGFIGRHVVVELERQSVSPVLMCRPTSKVVLSEHKVVYIDIKNNPLNAFELLGCPDVLIHLAWGGLPHYKSLHHIEDELPAQYVFLKGLIESGLKCLLVTGTCNEYGMQSGKLDESLPALPIHHYAIAKKLLFEKLQQLKSTHKYNLTWARLFYIFGEGQSKNSLLPQLREAINQRSPVFNMSGGEQLRDYSPVTEVARRLVLLARIQSDLGILNVCSGNPISVRELIEGWISENKWQIKLNLGYYPYPDYEALAFWGDSSKFEREACKYRAEISSYKNAKLYMC